MINDPLLFMTAEVIDPVGTFDHNVVKAAFIYDTPVQSSYLCIKSATKRIVGSWETMFLCRSIYVLTTGIICSQPILQ